MEENSVIESQVENPNAFKNKTKKEKTFFILNIVLNSIFYLFILFLLIFAVTQIVGSKPHKVKNIFGLGYETVETNSMVVGSTGEEIIDKSRAYMRKSSFDRNALVWVTTLNNKEKRKLKVGDIITFWDTVSYNEQHPNGFLNTHRIVKVLVDEKTNSVTGFIVQGDCYLGTEYDFELAENPNALTTTGKAQNIGLDVVKAKYIGHWDGTGKLLRFTQTGGGFALLIILPIVLFLIFEMFMVIKNMMALKAEKVSKNAEDEKQKLYDSLQAEKERMRQELLEELKKEQEIKNSENKED